MGVLPRRARFDGTRWCYEALLDPPGAGFDAAVFDVAVFDVAVFDVDAATRRAVALAADLRTPARLAPARLEVTAFPDAGAHVVAVERCVQAIRRGEIYQANIG